MSLVDPDGRETRSGSERQLIQRVLDYRFYENTTVLGVSASAIAPTGGGLSLGIAIGPNFSDVGIYGTVSYGQGVDVSISAKAATIQGDIQNVSGTHQAVTVHAGEMSGSLLAHDGHLTGAVVEGGPGVGVATLTTEHTGLVTAREIATAVGTAVDATSEFIRKLGRCFGPNAPHCWAHAPDARGPQTATTPADPPPTGQH
jgi:hypothetical protein